VFAWVRRIAGLVLVLAAVGGVFGFVRAPEGVAGPAVAAPAPSPTARPLVMPVDPAHAIVYQRGYEPRSRERVLVERWVMAGAAFRERVTVDGVLASDRSDGREVDYRHGEWRAGPVHGLDDDCARTLEEVQTGLGNGTVTVSGPGVAIAGQETTVLRHHGTPVVDLWVNAATQRPVRCRVAERDAITFDLVWLPATDTNLALLEAVVPDGFTAVAKWSSQSESDY
jgi:hypothetical protein